MKRDWGLILITAFFVLCLAFGIFAAYVQFMAYWRVAFG